MDKKLIFDMCVFFTMIVLRIVFPKKRRGFKTKRKTGIKNQDYFTKGTKEYSIICERFGIEEKDE